MIPDRIRNRSVLWLALGLLLAGGRLRSEIPDELQPALDRLSGQDTVTVRLELQSTITTGEGAGAVTAGAIAAVRATALPDRMEVHCPLNQIEEANESNRMLRHAMRLTMEALSITTIDDYLNGARELRRRLEDARLASATTAIWEGRPVRVLTFAVERREDSTRAWQESAKVWVGPDGVPLAAEYRVQAKRRFRLGSRDETVCVERYRFAQVGSRLVVTRHVREEAGGEGERKTLRRDETTLAVEAGDNCG